MRWILAISLILGSTLSGKAGAEENAAVLRKICEGTCSGRMAWIQEWRDASQARVYQYQGDLSTCSHPPQIFYDAGGKELGTIAEFPVNSQDPVATAKLKEIQNKRTEWLNDLSPGKKLWCDRLGR